MGLNKVLSENQSLRNQLVLLQGEDLAKALEGLTEEIISKRVVEQPTPIETASERLGMTVAHLKLLGKEDGLPIHKLRSKYFVIWSEVIEWMKLRNENK